MDIAMHTQHAAGLRLACLRLLALAVMMAWPPAAFPQALPPAMLMVDVIGELKVTTPAEAIAKRAALSQVIWGGATPAAYPVTPLAWSAGAGQSIEATLGRAPAEQGWLVSSMEKGLVARTLYAKFAGSTCLFIINAGHSPGVGCAPRRRWRA